MANEQMYPGLLSQFGLDITEHGLREQDLLRRQQTGLQLADSLGYRGPAAGSAQAGALFAAALGNRGYKPSDQESRRIETAKVAGDSMNQWLAQNPDAKEKDKALIYQKFLAESAFRNGLPDIGSAAMQQFEQAKLVRETQDLQLRKLGREDKLGEIEVEMAPEAAKAERFSWGLKRQATVWPVGSRDVTDARDLRMDDDFNAVDADGNIVYRAGEYTTHAPPVPTGGGGGGGGGGESMLTPTAAEGYRQIQTASTQMMDGVEKLDDIIVGAASRDGQVDILGWGGGVASRATELADNVTATINNVGKVFGVAPGSVEIETGEFDSDTGKKKTIDARTQQSALYKEYKGDVDAVMGKYVPERLRATGRDAIRARTNLLNITYAIMRAKEPGNNRYSDNDFKNALKLAGEGLADPNKLRETLYDRVQESFRHYDIAKSQLTPEMHDRIWAPESRAIFDQRRADFEQRFGKFAVQPKAQQGAWKIVKRPGQN